ncbi:hypothetical protein [Kineococcus aurantiacus]|uniref:Uncharacterized protein n=1 Tax=Kineococcus aurantiacus TaxID=37633 RepID=A0A7Y9J363_9ACTN|nr:hypothetical protein [Kineococcus aurantiacus]NYD25012.1 hypothetical protein [Kineococcus aurantiacus]
MHHPDANGSVFGPRLLHTTDVTDWSEELRAQLHKSALSLEAQARRPMLTSEGEVESETTGWTLEVTRQLLTELAVAGAGIQVQVINRAIEQGGFIARAEVYDLAGYPASRSLKGFTRPVNRIVRSFRDSGDLPEDAADLLQPVYDPTVRSYQRTAGFMVPQEVVGLLAPAPAVEPARLTTTVKDPAGRPVSRDIVDAALWRKLDAEKAAQQHSVRLRILSEAEAQVVMQLLDELSGVYAGERLGNTARELSVRLHERLTDDGTYN